MTTIRFAVPATAVFLTLLLPACGQAPVQEKAFLESPPAPVASDALAAHEAAGNKQRLQAQAAMVRMAPSPAMDWQAPRESRERYARIDDNPVRLTSRDSISTLSLDVDTGAYSNVRRFLNQGRLPPKDAVRVEELVNYFPYDYPQAQGPHPFAISTELGRAPWNPEHLVLRVGVKAVEQQVAAMPPANLVFLVDVSGSMDEPDKLPLVKAALNLLVDQLRAEDRIALVVYSGRTAVELASTSGREKQKIRAAIAGLQAGGSTAGGEAMKLAYEQARSSFIKGGINRILLATDGDFNVGVTDLRELKGMVERERSSGISLTTLGFGQGNYHEALMEQLADAGNGNYSYVDSLGEARKVLVDELSATFNTVAADVKLQLEFNPAVVGEWRLIGYENRVLDEQDFKNDKVDAVEIGAGKSVTALYELTPVGKPLLHDPRRYGTAQPSVKTALNTELAYLRIRYKKPGERHSVELAQPLAGTVAASPGADWQFATAVAGFGQLLRGGNHMGDWSMADARALAQAGYGKDPQGYRHEFVRLLGLAESLLPKAAEQDEAKPASVGLR